jgi:hypothetical protein
MEMVHLLRASPSAPWTEGRYDRSTDLRGSGEMGLRPISSRNSNTYKDENQDFVLQSTNRKISFSSPPIISPTTSADFAATKTHHILEMWGGRDNAQ